MVGIGTIRSSSPTRPSSSATEESVDIENKAEDYAYLSKEDAADISSDGLDAVNGDRSDVLTLRRGPLLEPVPVVGSYLDLRTELADARGEWNDLDDVGGFVKYFLGCDDHDRMAKSCLSTRWSSEVEVD